MSKVSQLLLSVEEFPTLPTIYLKLVNTLDNPDIAAADVASAISMDPAASAKLLKVANSSLYSFRGRVSSISQAIFNIGFVGVKNVILSMGIMQIFTSLNFNNRFSAIELWKHSLAVGVLSAKIASCVPNLRNDDYFVAGLLHDIGKLFLLNTYKHEYIEAVNFAYKKKIHIREAEVLKFGISHCEAGAILAEKWSLPLGLRRAIRNHHAGVIETDDDILPAIVNVADCVAMLYEMGDNGYNTVERVPKEIWDRLNLPTNFFTKNMQDIVKEYEETLSIFTINDF